MDEAIEMIQETDDIKEYLIFAVDSIEFGIDIGKVIEIIKIQPFSAVPNALDFCRGIINLRGTIVPVVDMRIKLGFPEIEYNERTCIIVIMLGQELIGIVVDAVRDVIHLAEKELLDANTFYDGGERRKYTSKIAVIDGKIKQILDAYSVFDIEEEIDK